MKQEPLSSESASRQIDGSVFLRFLREEFLSLNTKLVGDIRRDELRDLYISRRVADFIGRSFTDGPAPVGFEAAGERLLHRFEVLCSRMQKDALPLAVRQEVYDYLLEQLRENISTLGLKPAVLVTATLLNECPLFTLPQEEEFRDLLQRRPYLLHRAMTACPREPREFLRLGIRRLSEIAAQLECSGEKMQEHVRYRLAFNHPRSPVGPLVRDRQSLVKKLQGEPEFRDMLAGRRSVAQELAGLYKEEYVRPRLREIKLLQARVLADERFARYRDRPADIIVAAIRHPQDTESFLLGVLAREDRIRSALAERGLRMPIRELRSLCLKTPDKALRFELSLLSSQPIGGAGDSALLPLEAEKRQD